jgi:hypothetical protein
MVTVGAALLGLLSASWAASAGAQERPYYERHVAAPTSALELKVGGGYTQGFGMIAPNQNLRDTVGPGLGVNADIDLRLDPHWSIGIQGEYQEFASERNTAARGVATNIGFTYHGAPFLPGDPWLRLGAGYRMLWNENPADRPWARETILHGFELGKATIGWDFRLSEDVGLAPVLGADLNLFEWRLENGGNASIGPTQVGTFVYAGLQGRFDIGGSRTMPGAVVGRR